jgi:uncharacterized repeat protein (TIGR01451 family)
MMKMQHYINRRTGSDRRFTQSGSLLNGFSGRMRAGAFGIVALSLFGLLILAGNASPQEILYPLAGGLDAQYQLSADSLDIHDTLTITWTLTNNGNFPAANLFFNDNLPPDLQPIWQRTSINGDPIEVLIAGPVDNEVRFGFRSYHWIIDLPDPGDTLNNILGPGQMLEISYRVTARRRGQFLLPFHTVCFYGDTTGYFSISESLTVIVTSESSCDVLPGDANDDMAVNGLDVVFSVNFFKGGMTPPIFCDCPPRGVVYASADANGSCEFNGIDVTYMVNYFKGRGEAPLACPDCL